MKCHECGKEFRSETDVGITLTTMCLVCDEIAYNIEMDKIYDAQLAELDESERDPDWHHEVTSDIKDDGPLPF